MLLKCNLLLFKSLEEMRLSDACADAQGFPACLGGQEEILVRGVFAVTVRAHRHRLDKACCNKARQYLFFISSEIHLSEVTLVDGGRGAHRVLLAQHHVSYAYSELEDEAGVETVAEVYDARDMRARFVDEHVLLVGIILNDGPAKTGQFGDDEVVEARYHLLLKGSIARIDDAGAEALEGWDMCEIPQQDPPCKAHRNLGEEP
mmetsp:Transcript_11872/g.17044  ORF Transcript_11872/g.17044 Transcript_11872/m.17044 type:complete len:204 (-) Transcript_11872:534-1145(-)